MPARRGPNMSPNKDKPAMFDRWFIASLMAAILAMAIATLVILLPTWKFTWILIVGAIVFIWMMLHHPEHWYRRTAAFMLASAVGLSLPPMLRAEGNIHGIGRFSFVLD